MSKTFGELSASIQQKIDGDTDFQSSIESLSDEEKATAIETKKSELLDAEIGSLDEKATKAQKAEELASNYKQRSEKAEGELKKFKPKEEDKGTSQGDLNSKDLIALIQAKVPEDDIDDVVEYAKFKGISVAEALKTSVIKTTLADKEEFRTTAAASNSGGGKRVTSKVTTETLLKEASEGKFPEKGTADAEALFWARRGGKR